MTAPVSTTTIARLTAISDELLVNRDGDTALQRTADLAAQLASNGAVATSLENVRAETSASIADMKSRLEAAAEGYITAATWAALASVSGSRDKQPGRVAYSDNGTHTDPVSAMTVPNSGEYTWNAGVNGWQRTGDVIDEKFSDLLKESRNALLPAATSQPMMDDYWQTVFQATADGTVNAGIDREGHMRIAALFDAPGVPALTDDYLWAIVTEAGELVIGYHFVHGLTDGKISRDLQVSDYVAGGVSRVIATTITDTIVPITFGEADAWSVGISGDDITYVTGGVLAREDATAVVSLAAAINTLQHHLVYGQSLSDGSSTGGAVSTVAVAAGKAVMFNVGPAVRGTLDANVETPRDNRKSLVDLKETGRETPSSQIGYEMAKSLPATQGVLVSAHGRGGTTYQNLKKGTQPYKNLVSSVRRARIIAGLNGLDLLAPTVSWIHGEQNLSDSAAVYRGYMEELQADLTADLAVYTGAAGEALLFLDQISNWTRYGSRPVTSYVPQGQLQAALQNPGKIFCVCPKYMLETSDGVHMTAESSARLGAYHGRAVRQTLAGSPWLPLHIASAVRTGGDIVLTYAGGDAATEIQIDTALVTNPGNYGFEWSQTGGTVVTLSTIAKTGARQITITLTGDPGAPTASAIGYAMSGVPDANGGPTTGPRGNVRDGSADLTSRNAPMHNWACHQLVNL